MDHYNWDVQEPKNVITSDEYTGIELQPINLGQSSYSRMREQSPISQTKLHSNKEEAQEEEEEDEFHITKTKKTISLRRIIGRLIECSVVILIIGLISFIIRQFIKPRNFHIPQTKT